jgi:hypothetical protein
VPQPLREAIAQNKKILVLINPPYAEATNSANTSISGRGEETITKEGVKKTKLAEKAMDGYGKASNELFMQFVARIALEIPNATLAMFSKLKYVTSPTLSEFRNIWKAKYLGGFVVHSKAFDGLKGDFPIGFLIWKTNNPHSTHRKNESVFNAVVVDVLDKNAKPIGEKTFYNAPEEKLLTNWVNRPKSNKTEIIPLKNVVSPATVTKDLRGTKWSDNAIGYMFCGGNDFQTSFSQTSIFSSGYSSGRGFFMNPENLWQAAIVFSVRRLIKPTWLNDRDQFLQPTQPLSNEFKSDCLIWMLFNGSNLTAGANGLEWNGRTWSLVNHFIPYTEAEVNAPDRFESDFMVQYLHNLPILNEENVTQSLSKGMQSENTPYPKHAHQLSPEAQAVLAEGKKLWHAYFAHTDTRNTRDELKLNRPDVGWYQVRKALEARDKSGDYMPTNFKPFKEAYQALSEKLQPQVYSLGFLKS